jgi:hypothetical protein
MRFGMWNMRKLYRVDCLMTVSKVLSKYKLERFIGSIGCEMGGTEQASEYVLFCRKGSDNHE